MTDGGEREGTPGYPLAMSSWDDAEHKALLRVIESGNFTMGSEVAAFERDFAEFIGTRHAVMVNSGSSANLLLLSALRFHSEWGYEAGGEVIVPAVSWGTTYFPVTQNGLTLRFVDVSPDDWNIDVDQVADAINEKTVAVFAVSLLGAPADFARLRAICASAGVLLIEDNCESLGASVQGKMAGSFGVGGTHSGFFSHHICTMEGGVVTTDDDELRDLMVSMRAHGWLRGLPEQNFVHPLTGDPFLDSFTFALPGYNLRPLEFSGATGREQMVKLPDMLRIRRENAVRFLDRCGVLPGVGVQRPLGESSWFGFGMLLHGDLEDKRTVLVDELRKREVDCRPVVAGNFTKNPVMRHLPHVIEGELVQAEALDSRGLFVGNHHVPIDRELDLVVEAIEAARASG